MATLAQLEKALVNADKAGDMDAARKLAAVIKAERERVAPMIGIPGYSEIGDVPGTVADKPSASILDMAKGAGEAALTVATGIPAAVAGAVVGVGKGIYDQIRTGGQALDGGVDAAADLAAKVTESMTYQPRTETGQAIVTKVGEVAAPLAALGPVAAELGAVSDAVRAVRPVARAAAAEVAAPIKQAAMALTEKVTEQITPGAKTATAGTGLSMGAAADDMANIRQGLAGELPIPIRLTEGQKTRAFEQQRFERETAKMGDIGEPIRQRFQEQNLKLQQNMDAFIDSTGAELTEARGVGEIVDKALRSRAARDKAKIRALYKEAEKAGEMEARVPMDSLDQILKDSASAEGNAPILAATRKELERLGALNYFGRGEGINLKLADAENLRKFVNRNAGSDKTNISYAKDIKDAIDAATEGKGGDLYKKARAAHSQAMSDYENFGLARTLLKSKRGSADRTVALEDVLRKSVISPSASVDDVSKLRQLLQTEGETGVQAWKELQGGLLRHLKDEATKNVARDAAGNPVVSAAGLDRAVTALDKTGKLDLVLGKKKAEMVRTINDVAKDILTAPPGAVNTSNTATVLAGLFDVAASGMTGVPLPVATAVKQATSRIKDARLRARVKAALGDDHVRH